MSLFITLLNNQILDEVGVEDGHALLVLGQLSLQFGAVAFINHLNESFALLDLAQLIHDHILILFLLSIEQHLGLLVLVGLLLVADEQLVLGLQQRVDLVPQQLHLKSNHYFFDLHLVAALLELLHLQ